MSEKKKLTLAAARESLEIFEFVRPYKLQFVLGLVFLFLSSVVFMAVVQLPGIMVDIAQGNSKYGLTLGTAALVLGGILIFQGFMSYWRVMMFAKVAESGVADIRRALYGRLVSLPMFFFEKSRVGELVSRLTADVEKLYNTFYFVLAEFVRQIIVLLVGLVVMGWQHPRLSLVMLAVFPVVVIGAMFFGKQVRKLSKQRQEQLADSNVILDETLQSISAVKAFSNEMFEIGRFTRSSDSVVKVSMKYAAGRALFSVFIITVLFGALFFIIWMGARMLQAGQITSGELLSFGINTAIIGGAIAGLAEASNGNLGGAAVYQTIVLPNFTLAGGGYYVIGNSASIPNVNQVVTPTSNLIQNGSPDAIGLRDPSNILLDAVSYEGNSGAPYTEGSGIALANSDGSTAGIGISRFPDGSDTNDNSVDWSAHCLSPGAANLGTSTNCICTPPEATADVQCIDNLTWQITVHVTSTGSGSVVNITNDVNGSSALNAGVGDHILGPFNNNATVNVTVAHESFSLCNLTLSGLFDNCVIDCNGVQGGSALPGTVCDDGDAGTVNDVWSPGCVCAGTPIVPIVGFVLPSSTAGETDVAMTVGLEMDIAPTGPVVVNVSDLFTGTATSGATVAPKRSWPWNAPVTSRWPSRSTAIARP